MQGVGRATLAFARIAQTSATLRRIQARGEPAINKAMTMSTPSRRLAPHETLGQRLCKLSSNESFISLSCNRRSTVKLKWSVKWSALATRTGARKGVDATAGRSRTQRRILGQTHDARHHPAVR